MTDWLDALARQRDAGRPAGLVTVVEALGSTPREAGAKMTVTADAVHGTIGGGNLELQAIALAREAIDRGRAPRIERFSLGPALGQCCGGSVRLMIERVDPAADWVPRAAELSRAGESFGLETDIATGAKRIVAAAPPLPPGERVGVRGHGRSPEFQSPAFAAPPPHPASPRGGEGQGVLVESIVPPDLEIVMFGAGHVGQALAVVLGQLPCRVTWIDTRDEQFPVEIPSNVVVCPTNAPEGHVRQARPGSYFLVMTHSHSVDYDLCEAILRRGDFAYLGLIGSATKRRRFEKRLLAHGIPADRVRRLTSPIGIDGITGKHPGTIAIAAAAEILRLHAARTAAAGHAASPEARTVGAGG